MSNIGKPDSDTARFIADDLRTLGCKMSDIVERLRRLDVDAFGEVAAEIERLRQMLDDADRALVSTVESEP